MKKAYIKHLTIEVGTKCNLNCGHCYMGSQKHNFVIQPKYIDALIENTYKINELIIMGGEITLYPDVVEMVLNKFAESKIPIEKLIFISNVFQKSEKIVNLFNWFSSEFTLNPDEAIIKISSDKFHTSCNPKFTKKELEENSKWYAEKTNNRAVNDVSDWIGLKCNENNSPRSITIKNNSFASYLLEWEYCLYNFVVEVFNFTIQNNHSGYELKRFRKIDDDMTNRIETIRKYAYIYSNEEIKDCLKKYFEIENFDVSKLKKQIESLIVFSKKTQQYKDGIISKNNYRLWFYHFLEDYIKPQNTDEQLVFNLSKALYEWDLKEYERLYSELYKKLNDK